MHPYDFIGCEADFNWAIGSAGGTQSKSQMDQFAGSISGFNDLKVPLYLEDDHH